VVLLRLWEPVVSHALANPPQELHAPYVVVWQVVPSVVRVHEVDSLVTTFVHAPAEQVGVVTERVCVPVVSQVLAYPPQVPHAP
jgi:hypothetical protein